MDTDALAFVEDALSALERALHDRGAELRNVQLATGAPSGPPGLRTLVLRGFERDPATAEMHTDARAAKARDIASADQVSLLAWSAADRLQLRFEGAARLHRDDDLARARWDRLSPEARAPYGLRAGPGTPLADPRDRAYLPPDEQYRAFAVILVALSCVDVLRLGPAAGQQTRARGRFTPSGLAAEWVSP